MTPSPKATVTEKLDGLGQKIDGLSMDFRVFVTKLMGDPDDEQSTGRLPMLEHTAITHEKRIRRLENLAIRGTVVVSLVWAALELFTYLHH